MCVCVCVCVCVTQVVRRVLGAQSEDTDCSEKPGSQEVDLRSRVKQPDIQEDMTTPAGVTVSRRHCALQPCLPLSGLGVGVGQRPLW